MESTNRWEDLYHHYLLPGYSNNSQIAPHNTSSARCDVTRYFDGEGQNTMLFTEVKRANRAEATTGIADAETQVLNYSSAYLKAKGSGHMIYACTTIGPFIRCFLVRYPDGIDRDGKGPEPALSALLDLLGSQSPVAARPVNVTESTIESYKDAGNDDHAKDIRKCFRKIKSRGAPPFASCSRPHSSSSFNSLSPPASLGCQFGFRSSLWQLYEHLVSWKIMHAGRPAKGGPSQPAGTARLAVLVPDG